MTRVGSAAAEVAKINNLFRSGTCGSNFSLTRAERSPLLPFPKPADWTAIVKNNATNHATKFEVREKSTVGHSIINLGAPTGIAVCRECG
jgi:hypothetical protein